jgi:hypothetical protein
VAGSCQRGDKPSGSIKCWDVVQFAASEEGLSSVSKYIRQSVQIMKASLRNCNHPATVYLLRHALCSETTLSMFSLDERPSLPSIVTVTDEKYWVSTKEWYDMAIRFKKTSECKLSKNCSLHTEKICTVSIQF